MYDWVFGCDICQDVCPVNIKGAYTTEQEFLNWRFTTLNLLDLLEMEESEFEERFRNSPIKRAKRVGLQRNACVALGNACDESTVPALSRALETGHPLVRGHAAWALGKIGNLEAQQALRISLKTEEDPIVLEEIAFAISMESNGKNNS
jgi:epoxyqueuosine reductase